MWQLLVGAGIQGGLAAANSAIQSGQKSEAMKAEAALVKNQYDDLRQRYEANKVDDQKALEEMDAIQKRMSGEFRDSVQKSQSLASNKLQQAFEFSLQQQRDTLTDSLANLDTQGKRQAEQHIRALDQVRDAWKESDRAFRTAYAQSGVMGGAYLAGRAKLNEGMAKQISGMDAQQAQFVTGLNDQITNMSNQFSRQITSMTDQTQVNQSNLAEQYANTLSSGLQGMLNANQQNQMALKNQQKATNQAYESGLSNLTGRNEALIAGAEQVGKNAGINALMAGLGGAAPMAGMSLAGAFGGGGAPVPSTAGSAPLTFDQQRVAQQNVDAFNAANPNAAQDAMRGINPSSVYPGDGVNPINPGPGKVNW